MKKLLIMLALSALLLISAFAAEKTVYLSDGGTGDGSSASSPVGTLADAYAVLGNAGGKIVIKDTYTLSSKFTEPAHTGKITITGGTLSVGNIRFVLNGATTFENITISGKTYLTVIAQFNPIVFGEGITVSGFGDFLSVSEAITIIGGVQGSEDKYDDASLVDNDVNITVKSGKALIICFSRQVDKTFTGTVYLNIEGGTFTNIYLGTSGGGVGGSVEMNVSGGTFLRNIFSNAKITKVGGSVNVRISGGDFSASTITRFDGSVTGNGATSTADVRGLDNYSIVVGKMEGFGKIITDEGELTPSEKGDMSDTFLSGSFTASDGTVLPYRYYLPEGYETSNKEYPIFLYMHGNGSRGTNNTSQFSVYSINNTVYSSIYECIMIAPQCPSSPYEWTLNTTVGKNYYPGSEAYAEFFESGDPYGSKYFCAAAELLGMFLEEYRVDTSRVYAGGSSNGTGAVWNLMALYPEVFAGAVTVSGAKADADYAHAIAHRMTDIAIWAFQGDSDTTIPVEGTRVLVEAIEEAGGNIIYTEVEGGTHGNIWKTAADTPGIVDWLFAQKNDSFENTITKAKGSKLTAPKNLTWKKTTASWDAVDNAGAYKVMFYVNGTLKKTVFTCNNYYTPDLASFGNGDYTFSVTAFPKNNDYSVGTASAKSKAYDPSASDLDFNEDGNINIADVLVLVKALVDETTVDGGDLSGDKKFSLLDVLQLLKKITE